MFAGVTSLISILEVIVAALQDKLGWARVRTTLTVAIPLAIISMALFSTTTALSVLDTADAFVNSFGIMAVALVAVIIVAWLLHKLPVLVEHLNRRSSFRVGTIWKVLVGVLAPVVLGYLFISEHDRQDLRAVQRLPRLVPRDLRLGDGHRAGRAGSDPVGDLDQSSTTSAMTSRVRRVPLEGKNTTGCGDLGDPADRHDHEGSQRMTTTAIVMMIIAMVTVWGGLVAGIVNLARHPEESETEPRAARRTLTAIEL